jgi:hypothetical protein
VHCDIYDVIGSVKIDFVSPMNESHVRWVPCHHGMARPQVPDGRNGLQIWRVATDILNKQSWTAKKGWSSSLGLGVGLTTPHHKKLSYYENSQEALDMRFGTWNVRSIYRAGLLRTVAEEVLKYKLDLLGV